MMLFSDHGAIHSWHNNCRAFVPELVCGHTDLIVYIAPSIFLAILIGILSRKHPFFFLFQLTGTICHELAHLCVGLLTGARPASFSIIPLRVGSTWVLGSVVLTNVRWYNAAPAALAPFLILILPLLVAYWRTRAGVRFEMIDLILALVLAPQFLSFWPSAADWKIAIRSWPYLALGVLAWWWRKNLTS